MTELQFASTEEIVAEIERRNYAAVLLCIVEDRRTDDTCRKDEFNVTCYVSDEDEVTMMQEALEQYIAEEYGDD